MSNPADDLTTPDEAERIRSMAAIGHVLLPADAAKLAYSYLMALEAIAASYDPYDPN